MTGGMEGKGFFAGAVGGLALALLLVGVASFLPLSNSPVQTASQPQMSAALGGAASATTTTEVISTSTTASSAQVPASQSGGQNQAGGAAVTTTVTATATTTAASTTTVATGAATTAWGPSMPGSLSGLSGSGVVKEKPSSLLTVLPGESVASLLTTLSPLIIGFLVAALVYGAYTRRQDSSS